MIAFDLACAAGHRFEGWFASSGDFDAQHANGLLSCPQCGSVDVSKAPMAPAVTRKGNQIAAPPSSQPAVSGEEAPAEAGAVIAKLAQIQAEMLRHSRWVGKDFAEQSRKMHYGEADAEVIHGQASAEQARDLLDEGIAVVPLPFPVASPDDLN